VPGPGESPLVLVDLPPPEAADEVRRAWDRGDAVAVVDPRAPKARLDSLVEALRPTHMVGTSGSARLASGRPVPGDVAAVVSTSGTTAEPRHVLLTRAGMEASARAVTSALGSPGADDRWLCCVPLHYVAGLAIVARSYFCQTAMTVHSSFEVGAVAAAADPVGADPCTLVSLVPTMLARLLDSAAPLGRFRRILLGGAPITPSLWERATGAGARMVRTYGLSETGGGCVHDGEPLTGVELSFSPVGEILVQGPVVMRGYHRDPAATEHAFTSDGRLRTGDLGRLGADGRLQVIDRLKDIVITGGVNVSPVAVERVLSDHPLVADVCVAGQPDDEWGERVVAFVVPLSHDQRPTLEDLRRFGADRLSAPELPREVRYVDAVPRSSSGKVLRRELPAGPGPG
jgi:o-succinylbenzoate---CoA ligase